MESILQIQTNSFPLCSANEMESRLESLDFSEKLKHTAVPYLLKYADSEKTGTGVISVIRGMLSLIAPAVTDEEYKKVLSSKAMYIRAIVEDWDDANKVIAYWDILMSA